MSSVVDSSLFASVALFRGKDVFPTCAGGQAGLPILLPVLAGGRKPATQLFRKMAVDKIVRL